MEKPNFKVLGVGLFALLVVISVVFVVNNFQSGISLPNQPLNTGSAVYSAVGSSGSCQLLTYGDVTGDGGAPAAVDLDDLLCVTSGIGGEYNCPFAFSDISPCQNNGASGDGVLDVDDLNSVLGALNGPEQSVCTNICRPCINNILPVANAGPDQNTTVGAVLNFNGAGSTDSDTTTDSGPKLVRYVWDFGDGATTSHYNPTISHTFSQPGTYQVRLTVTDRCNGVSPQDMAVVTVTAPDNLPPVANAGSDRTVNRGATTYFNGGQSFDPDGTIASYQWNFGDGQNASGISVGHTYSVVGTYTVTLTVTDNLGLSDNDTATVTVTEPSQAFNPRLVGFISPGQAGPGIVNGVDVSDDGTKLYVASNELGVIEYDIVNTTQRLNFSRTANVFQPVFGVVSNNSNLVTGGAASTAQVTPLNGYATDNETWTSLGSVAQGVALKGNTAVVAVGLQDSNGNGGGLRIMNLANPTVPQAFFPMSARAVALSNDGRLAYVAAGAFSTNGVGNPGGLRIIDISVNPPQQIGALAPIGTANSGDIVLNSAGTIAYLADYSGGLRIVDVSNPASPQHLGSISIVDPIRRVAVSGNYAYVVTDGGAPRMRVFNVSNPSVPVQVGNGFPGSFPDIDVQGNYVYLTSGTLGLYVIDVSQPSLPTLARAITSFIGNRTTVAANGSVVIASGPVVGVTDVAVVTSVPDPDEPGGVGTIVEKVSQLNFGSNDIAMRGDYAYVATPNLGLKIVNVSVPAQPNVITTINTSAKGVAITNDGRWLYVAAQTEGVKVYDVLNPQSPVLRTTLDTPGSAFDITFNQNETLAFVADYAGGMLILDVTNREQPRVLGTYSTTAFGPVSWTGAVSTPVGEFAMAAGGNAQYLHIVNVSNPAAPYRVGTVPTSSAMTSFSHYALIPAGAFGLMVVNLSDPTHPVTHSVVDLPGAVLSAAVFGDKVYLGDSATIIDAVDLEN